VLLDYRVLLDCRDWGKLVLPDLKEQLDLKEKSVRLVRKEQLGKQALLEILVLRGPALRVPLA